MVVLLGNRLAFIIELVYSLCTSVCTSMLNCYCVNIEKMSGCLVNLLTILLHSFVLKCLVSRSIIVLSVLAPIVMYMYVSI